MGTDAQCIVDPCVEGSVKKLKNVPLFRQRRIRHPIGSRMQMCEMSRALTTLETSPIRQTRLLSPLTDGAVGTRLTGGVEEVGEH
jgi:hypothetical protein